MLSSQWRKGEHTLEHSLNVKNTFIHYPSSALGSERRCNSAPPQRGAVRNEEDEGCSLRSGEEDTVSCSGSSQTSFSILDADSGASTPECFSPRGHQKFSDYSIADPMQYPTFAPVPLMDDLSAMPNATLENSRIHTITLRRADGVSLGLEFSEQGQWLGVEAVTIHGAVDAWNRQCQMSNRQILPGDYILAVNLASDPETMRREVCEKLLVKLRVHRGPRHFEEIIPCVPQFFAPVLISPVFMPPPQFDYCTEEQLPARDKVVETARHVWLPDVKKFAGKHTKVTKTEELPLGEFAFMIHAHAVSSQRGGSSFLASEGRGTIHVKCNSERVGRRTVRVTVGEESHTSTHDFSVDSICKIPTVFDFNREIETKGKIEVAFDFS
jgi:hypothetical protein